PSSPERTAKRQNRIRTRYTSFAELSRGTEIWYLRVHAQRDHLIFHLVSSGCSLRWIESTGFVHLTSETRGGAGSSPACGERLDQPRCAPQAVAGLGPRRPRRG